VFGRWISSNPGSTTLTSTKISQVEVVGQAQSGILENEASVQMSPGSQVLLLLKGSLAKSPDRCTFQQKETKLIIFGSMIETK